MLFNCLRHSAPMMDGLDGLWVLLVLKTYSYWLTGSSSGLGFAVILSVLLFWFLGWLITAWLCNLIFLLLRFLWCATFGRKTP